jgi:hypothetical protein
MSATEKLTKWATQFKEPLAEIDAQLFEQLQATYVSLLGDAELPRHWPELSPDVIPDAIDYLNLCTSVKNTVPCKYVDSPMANGEVYEGRWRQAFIRRVMQGEVTKLVQVLRRGWAETISWDEGRVRVARFLQDQPTGANASDYERYIEISWPNCSLLKLDAMVASLNEREYVNPVIENEVRTGTWRNLGVTTSKSDDGSGVITMSLAISHFRLDSYITWLTHRTEKLIYLFGWGKDEAQAVIDAWKGKGKGATVSYRKEEGLIDLILRERDYDQLDVTSATSSWDCRYKTSIDYHFGVSNPESYPLITPPANGVSYDRQLRDNGDGSWDILIITRTVQYRDIPFQVSRVQAGLVTETRQQLGLTTQTPEAMTEVDGQTKEQRAEVRDDCSKDVVTNRYVVTDIFKTSHDNDGLVRRTIEDHSAAAVDLPSEIPVQGQKIGVENQRTEFPGKTKTRRIVEEAQHVSVPEFVSHRGEGTISYISEELHDTDAPDVMVYKDQNGVERDITLDANGNPLSEGNPYLPGSGNLTTIAILSHNYDDYLTHSYKKSRTIKKFPFEGESVWDEYGDFEYVTTQIYSETLGRYWNNQTLVYRVHWTHNEKYFTSRVLANAYIDGGVWENNNGSRVSHTGDFEYFADRVIKTKVLITTYTYLEPIS